MSVCLSVGQAAGLSVHKSVRLSVIQSVSHRISQFLSCLLYSEDSLVLVDIAATCYSGI